MHPWHAQKLVIGLPDGGKPDWWIDFMLIDTVIRDCMSATRGELRLWRIHRRAAADTSGHVLSFFYMSTGETHGDVSRQFAQHQVTTALIAAGLVLRHDVAELGGSLEATSDPNWPDPLRRAWPHFVSGVSATFLELIDQVRTSTQPSPSVESTEELRSYYTDLMEQVDCIWREHGSHAFFHHVNAIFGYTPVVARPRAIDGMLAVF